MLRLLLISGLAACGALAPAPMIGPRPGPATIAIQADLEGEAIARGRTLAMNGCAGCHAIGRTGASPLPAAPPFRDVVRRRSMEDLARRFEQGLVTDHPAMPLYTFRASEIDDLRAYLEALQEPASRRRPG